MLNACRSVFFFWLLIYGPFLCNCVNENCVEIFLTIYMVPTKNTQKVQININSGITNDSIQCSHSVS